VSAVVVDRASLLAELDGASTLGACEEALNAEGLTLAIDAAAERGLDVATWLARGAPGARDPWSDPADHLVAGVEVTLLDGRPLVVRPTPRRAVGPDLIALVVGMNERFAKVRRAWLRVHPRDAEAPRVHRLDHDRNPPLGEAESALLDAIAARLRGAP
jgi:alkyldihydroxyacetonephosphate synthase